MAQNEGSAIILHYNDVMHVIWYIVQVVICGKYKNLNKITKDSPWNLRDFLYLLFSTVYNAK